MPAVKSKRKQNQQHPGGEVHAQLVELDFWVKCAYLLTPAFLALFAGFEAAGLAFFIYPLISIVYFIIRHRYLKSLPPEQLAHVVPWSYIYQGRNLSMVILNLWLLMGLYALYQHFF